MKEFVNELKAPKYLALTFDDGPNITTTVQVLEKLEKYNVVASFFVIGDYINSETEPIIMKAINQGCEIDNHSKTHSAMPELTDEEIRSEIQYTLDKIKMLTGIETPFFRPPYIAVNERMLEIIDIPFICGYGCQDWEESVTVNERFQTVMEQVSDGSIILLHDLEGNDKTVDALDLIIPALKDQGYTFVTVSELFKKMKINPQKGIVYSNIKDGR
jgi:peptidoglycan/xylan/chitin deacetylase (PgdA/CDA1 family)